MTAATPISIPKKSQEAVIAFLNSCAANSGQNWNLREQMRVADLAYNRETDWTKENQRAKLANRLGDADKVQNLTIPVVEPGIEEAVTYQASVFLTGVPIFGCVADPANQDAAMQMETKIDNDAITGAWNREFLMFFRDLFKYNLGCVTAEWDRRIVPKLETDITFSAKQAKPKETIWTGNCIRRRDLYNSFWDTRCAPTQVAQKGEYFGWTELDSRIALKKYIAELPDKMIDNIKDAFESPSIGLSGSDTVPGGFYIPQINCDALVDKNIAITGTNWLNWASVTGADTKGGINYKDMYLRTTLYARILPIDFGLKVPSAATPQVWKFVIINNKILIYAERQTNAHDLIPAFFGQAKEDGLEYQTKSMTQNLAPIQNISTGLMNSVLASRRRAVSDRGIYDPLRITEAVINSPNPSAKMPVRPAAYGKPLAEAYFSIPFNDQDSGMILQMIPQVTGWGNLLQNQNAARQGQFVKGNKTRSEFESTMSHASGKDQMTAILLEDQVFTPLKQVLALNVLQYQGAETLYNRAARENIDLDPVLLRKAILQFKLADGLRPKDKLINADTLQTAIQVMGSSQQIGATYNMGPAFSYLMKTQGADLSAFEKTQQQIAYEQAAGRYQQLIMEAVKANATPEQIKAIPMPKPADYGYNPQMQSPQPGQQTAITPQSQVQ